MEQYSIQKLRKLGPRCMVKRQTWAERQNCLPPRAISQKTKKSASHHMIFSIYLDRRLTAQASFLQTVLSRCRHSFISIISPMHRNYQNELLKIQKFLRFQSKFPGFARLQSGPSYECRSITLQQEAWGSFCFTSYYSMSIELREICSTSHIKIFFTWTSRVHQSMRNNLNLQTNAPNVETNS